MLKAIIEKADFESLPEPLQAAYVEKGGKYEIQVEGMKTQADVDRVQNALVKERADHKAVKERVSLLGDRKIEDVVVLLDKIPELELAAAGKLDDKKIDQIVETRIATKLAPVVRERDQYKAQVAEREAKLNEYATRERSRTIHDAIRVAATKSKVLPEALEDALLLGERVFDIEEGTGRIITRDKVGVTPGIEPEVWFQDLQTKRPHWWGPTVGGGGVGNAGGGSGPNPFTAEHWNMTEQGKLYAANPSRAEQLAKAAGTTVGGPKPAAKK
jgi:hypothetical protein